MSKTIGHLPYTTLIVPLPGVSKLSVMNTKLHEAIDLMHQLEAVFGSKPALYFHSVEMQLAGYSAGAGTDPSDPWSRTLGNELTFGKDTALCLPMV